MQIMPLICVCVGGGCLILVGRTKPLDEELQEDGVEGGGRVARMPEMTSESRVESGFKFVGRDVIG